MLTEQELKERWQETLNGVEEESTFNFGEQVITPEGSIQEIDEIEATVKPTGRYETDDGAEYGDDELISLDQDFLRIELKDKREAEYIHYVLEQEYGVDKHQMFPYVSGHNGVMVSRGSGTFRFISIQPEGYDCTVQDSQKWETWLGHYFDREEPDLHDPFDQKISNPDTADQKVQEAVEYLNDLDVVASCVDYRGNTMIEGSHVLGIVRDLLTILTED